LVAKQALSKIKEATQATEKDEVLALLTKYLTKQKSPDPETKASAVTAQDAEAR
jgi:hypothetical protein